MTESDTDPATPVLCALAELRGTRPDAWTEGTIRERAVRLERANALIGMLLEGIRDVELSLAESMEEDRAEVAGVGLLERTEKVTSEWAYKGAGERMRDDLAIAVARTVATDVMTGEVDPMRRNLALQAIRTAYEAIPSFSSLKVNGRARLGMSMDDYRRFSRHYVVKLHSIEDEG